MAQWKKVKANLRGTGLAEVPERIEVEAVACLLQIEAELDLVDPGVTSLVLYVTFSIGGLQSEMFCD